jgi:UDP-glucose 4-epimerase
VLELYETCRCTAGSAARPVHEPARAGELARSVLDPERAAHGLGFRATTSLADGVELTWAWLKD